MILFRCILISGYYLSCKSYLIWWIVESIWDWNDDWSSFNFCKSWVKLMSSLILRMYSRKSKSSNLSFSLDKSWVPELDALQFEYIESPVVIFPDYLVGMANSRRILLTILHLYFQFLLKYFLPFVLLSEFTKPCQGAVVSEEYDNYVPILSSRF